ncbi:hypothetical protein J5N97_000107 [Dioscorea zingiberensis]|uniref:SMP domain-containing protein n=1 Tax=Dioscorea zingiberensis TaxID=325984 RepID=A0A9D5BSW8_9LILI|nr:hypothetical protein J5N97_000107 [Dioscorea zingiberensis]
MRSSNPLTFTPYCVTAVVVSGFPATWSPYARQPEFYGNLTEVLKEVREILIVCGANTGYTSSCGRLHAAECTITIGEALEASAQTAGDRPVDQSDAAAIQAAEVRATGSNVIIPGAWLPRLNLPQLINAGTERSKTRLRFLMCSGATAKLPADKAATRQDAEGVVSAELRNNPDMTTRPGGVAASVTAAARLNENMNVNT